MSKEIGCGNVVGRILGGFIFCGIVYNGGLALCEDCEKKHSQSCSGESQ